MAHELPLGQESDQKGPGGGEEGLETREHGELEERATFASTELLPSLPEILEQPGDDWIGRRGGRAGSR